MPDHKPYHHGNLRQAVLAASLDLIREKGIRAFTLREIARRADVSHGAPYRHFRDKADLLAAIAEEGFNRLTEAMHCAAAKATEPFPRLRNAGLAYIEFAQSQPEHFQVMFTADLDETRHPSAKIAAKGCFAELRALVDACLHAQRVKELTAEIAALLAWTHVHGVADLALRGQLGFKNKKELREFAKLAIDCFGRSCKLAEPNKH